MSSKEVNCIDLIERTFDSTIMERDSAYESNQRLNQHCDKLKKENEILREKNQQLREKNEKYKQEKLKFVGQKATAKNAVEALRGETEILKGQLVACHNDKLEMRLKNETLKITVDELRESIDEMDKRCQEYLHSSREKYEGLRVDFDRVCEELVIKQKELARCERELGMQRRNVNPSIPMEMKFEQRFPVDRFNGNMKNIKSSFRSTSVQNKTQKRTGRSRSNKSEGSRKPDSRIPLNRVEITNQNVVACQRRERQKNNSLTLPVLTFNQYKASQNKCSSRKRSRRSEKITVNLKLGCSPGRFGRTPVQNRCGQQDFIDSGHDNFVAARCQSNRTDVPVYTDVEESSANKFTFLSEMKSKEESAGISCQKVKLRHRCPLQ